MFGELEKLSFKLQFPLGSRLIDDLIELELFLVVADLFVGCDDSLHPIHWSFKGFQEEQN